jgi:hypothetical protein
MAVAQPTLRCSRCKRDLPVSNFRPRAGRKRGYHSPCKECEKKWAISPRGKSLQRARSNNHRKRLKASNPAELQRRQREQGLKVRYGLTISEYESRLAAQRDKCAICGSEFAGGRWKRRFSVDHDHKTGHIRGLLCGSCNRGLGDFRDNPLFLLKAIAYLQRSMSAPVENAVVDAMGILPDLRTCLEALLESAEVKAATSSQYDIDTINRRLAVLSELLERQPTIDEVARINEEVAYLLNLRKRDFGV